MWLRYLVSTFFRNHDTDQMFANAIELFKAISTIQPFLALASDKLEVLAYLLHRSILRQS